MNDELVLFAILCIIYVTDCFLWVGKFSLSFVTWVGRQWKDKVTSQIFRTSKGGILLLNPFPPLGKVVCCHLPPLSIAPTGICSLNCQALTYDSALEHDVVAVPFKEINSIRTSGLDIFVNEERFCRFRDVRQTERVYVLLNSLLNTTEANRETIIRKFWDEQFDFEGVRTRFKKVVHEMAFLRVLCNALFVYLFALAPALVLYFRMTVMLIPIAFGMLVIAIQISIEFYVLHRKLYPDANEDRISNLIKMILCPPVSIRACDLITEHLLGNFNPLVVGHLLLSGDRFRDFASRTLRNLKYPPEGYFTDRRAKRITVWQNHILLRIASGYLRNVPKMGGDFLRPPLPNDSTVHVYCPRCLCQFIQVEGDCPDCPGVKLLPFHSAIPAAESNG